MDPKQTLDTAVGAFIDGDYQTVFDSLVDYDLWREKGGFQPSVEYIDGLTAGDIVARTLWAKIRGLI